MHNTCIYICILLNGNVNRRMSKYGAATDFLPCSGHVCIYGINSSTEKDRKLNEVL